MLYRLSPSDDGEGLGSLKPIPFLDAAALQRTEKDLENLLATHLLDVLFEDALLPVFQERQLQSEADIYAINSEGDLVIFELKRGLAGEDAVLQAIGYAQRAGRWVYSELDRRFKIYRQNLQLPPTDLRDFHKDAFLLDEPLERTSFNRHQHLYIVGNAANEKLIDAIAYWKSQGLSVEFLPYRIYDLKDQRLFEFFSFPYDRHRNPSDVKGVLFDTNRAYDEESVWDMIEQSRVSAYGDVKYVVEFLNPGDIVFFYHKGVGLIAAAEVRGQVRKDEGNNEQYRDVRFLTPVPKRPQGIRKKMTAAQVTEATGKAFFWARALKVPYLSREEAQSLLIVLNSMLAENPEQPAAETSNTPDNVEPPSAILQQRPFGTPNTSPGDAEPLSANPGTGIDS